MAETTEYIPPLLDPATLPQEEDAGGEPPPLAVAAGVIPLPADGAEDPAGEADVSAEAGAAGVSVYVAPGFAEAGEAAVSAVATAQPAAAPAAVPAATAATTTTSVLAAPASAAPVDPASPLSAAPVVSAPVGLAAPVPAPVPVHAASATTPAVPTASGTVRATPVTPSLLPPVLICIPCDPIVDIPEPLVLLPAVESMFIPERIPLVVDLHLLCARNGIDISDPNFPGRKMYRGDIVTAVYRHFLILHQREGSRVTDSVCYKEIRAEVEGVRRAKDRAAAEKGAAGRAGLPSADESPKIELVALTTGPVRSPSFLAPDRAMKRPYAVVLSRKEAFQRYKDDGYYMEGEELRCACNDKAIPDKDANHHKRHFEGKKHRKGMRKVKRHHRLAVDAALTKKRKMREEGIEYSDGVLGTAEDGGGAAAAVVPWDGAVDEEAMEPKKSKKALLTDAQAAKRFGSQGYYLDDNGICRCLCNDAAVSAKDDTGHKRHFVTLLHMKKLGIEPPRSSIGSFAGASVGASAASPAGDGSTGGGAGDASARKRKATAKFTNEEALEKFQKKGYYIDSQGFLKCQCDNKTVSKRNETDHMLHFYTQKHKKMMALRSKMKSRKAYLSFEDAHERYSAQGYHFDSEGVLRCHCNNKSVSAKKDMSAHQCHFNTKKHRRYMKEKEYEDAAETADGNEAAEAPPPIPDAGQDGLPHVPPVTDVVNASSGVGEAPPAANRGDAMFIPHIIDEQEVSISI